MMAPPPGIKSTFIIPTDLLDDIASRFLLDAPDSELGNPISLCFLTELAYWFYLDEYAEEDDSLNNLKFDPFAQQLLNRVGFKPQTGTIEDMLQGFRDFKHRVPTYGGLLLNQDLSQVLLVQGFWHRASWGFPKGKINVDEEPHNCAIREVLEETGYDISPLIDPSGYLETSIGEQFVRLYIIPGVSTTTEFVPRTKGEIKQLKWFPISQLPSHKNDRNFNKVNGSTNMFYMVMPFVKPLREWLANRQRAAVNGTGNGAGREGRRRHRSSTTAADHNQSYSQTRHSHSPATTSDTAKRPQPTPDTSRKQQSTAFSSYIQEEAAGFERLRINTDSSPRRREASTKAKSRKSLFGEQEENPKFTFKSRGKGRSNKTNRENQPASNGNSSNAITWETKPNFRSYSWQSFHINKKEVMDAVERVWSSSTLGL
ncbi:m7GpppN-mRNA hydrolase [Procambarus clarkii]|uniref:m7GpppN-mRNA hydrolase n=1 Tax=Procambarus clarkii TaxID=6728 RepID=UPI001E67822A|nr:m7GpppN-mRNA hydrolase-like [Procambarus clarkii]